MLAIATIPPTLSHGERTVAWMPSGDPSDVQDGTLTITEHRGGVRRPRTVTQRYLVQETPAIGFAGREFLLVKDRTSGLEGTLLGHDEKTREGNVYTARVFSNGFGMCSCTAGNVGQHRCLHFLALKELIEQGSLQPKEDESPQWGNCYLCGRPSPDGEPHLTCVPHGQPAELTHADPGGW